VRVAYLGPAGTFAEEALRASAGEPVDELPYPTVHETVMAVQDGEVDRGVVPIENSLEGGVAATLDALATDADRVRIVAEVVHPVHHCAIAASELPFDDVRRVFSHPQATAQCQRFLRERLARAERVAAPSTAEAVRLVAEADEPWLALGSRLSAELYGARVLEADVEDRSDNETRFVWLGRAGEVDPPGQGTRAKTSVVFWGAGDESPGWLVAVLSELSEREINLTRIESRPRRVRLGHYMFFADLEGAEADSQVAEALTALRRRVESLRVLGSYPAA
jgi:prephenate dehydratase